jgi:hypothetical protein
MLIAKLSSMTSRFIAKVLTWCLGQNSDPPLAEKDLKFQGQLPSGPDAPVSYPVLAPRTRTRPRR